MKQAGYVRCHQATCAARLLPAPIACPAEAGTAAVLAVQMSPFEKGCRSTNTAQLRSNYQVLSPGSQSHVQVPCKSAMNCAQHDHGAEPPCNDAVARPARPASRPGSPACSRAPCPPTWWAAPQTRPPSPEPPASPPQGRWCRRPQRPAGRAPQAAGPAAAAPAGRQPGRDVGAAWLACQRYTMGEGDLQASGAPSAILHECILELGMRCRC